MPVTVSRRLAEAEPDQVTLEEFRAGHVEAFNSDPDAYVAAVEDFLRRTRG